MSPRTLLASLCVLMFPLAASAQSTADDASQLVGTVVGNEYVSPTGLYRIPIPVIPALGGQITDSPHVVTLRDAFTTHITIGVFPLDKPELADLQKLGRKGFLVHFFTDIFLAQLHKTLPTATFEAEAHYIAKTNGGSVLVYTLLPGGSAFNSRIFMFPGNDPIPVAKRGNLAFIHDNHVILISSELGERASERSAYTLTTAQEDAMLRQRLITLADSMELTTPESEAPAAPAPVTPSPDAAAPAQAK